MQPIIPNLLWTGNARDARNARAVLDADIAAIVDLAYEESPADLPRELIYCRFPLIDGAGNNAQLLRHSVGMVVQLLSAATPTLIACGGGMSRAPAIAAAAISMHRKEEPDTVLQSLAESQPHDVSAALWHEVVAVCGLET